MKRRLFIPLVGVLAAVLVFTATTSTPAVAIAPTEISLSGPARVTVNTPFQFELIRYTHGISSPVIGDVFIPHGMILPYLAGCQDDGCAFHIKLLPGDGEMEEFNLFHPIITRTGTLTVEMTLEEKSTITWFHLALAITAHEEYSTTVLFFPVIEKPRKITLW